MHPLWAIYDECHPADVEEETSDVSSRLAFVSSIGLTLWTRYWGCP